MPLALYALQVTSIKGLLQSPEDLTPQATAHKIDVLCHSVVHDYTQC